MTYAMSGFGALRQITRGRSPAPTKPNARASGASWPTAGRATAAPARPIDVEYTSFVALITPPGGQTRFVYQGASQEAALRALTIEVDRGIYPIGTQAQVWEPKRVDPFEHVKGKLTNVRPVCISHLTVNGWVPSWPSRPGCFRPRSAVLDPGRRISGELTRVPAKRSAARGASLKKVPLQRGAHGQRELTYTQTMGQMIKTRCEPVATFFAERWPTPADLGGFMQLAYSQEFGATYMIGAVPILQRASPGERATWLKEFNDCIIDRVADKTDVQFVHDPNRGVHITYDHLLREALEHWGFYALYEV